MAREDYIAIDDAAKLQGKSRATLWRWIRAHNLDTFRFVDSRKTYIRRSDVPRLAEPLPRHKESRHPDESE